MLQQETKLHLSLFSVFASHGFHRSSSLSFSLLSASNTSMHSTVKTSILHICKTDNTQAAHFLVIQRKQTKAKKHQKRTKNKTKQEFPANKEKSTSQNIDLSIFQTQMHRCQYNNTIKTSKTTLEPDLSIIV